MEEAIKRLNEQGVGYTETHGKSEGECGCKQLTTTN